MGVAITALAVALGGSAFAAGGAFESSDGTVQACVAGQNIVERVTGAVDQVTDGVLSPVTQGVNTVANALVDPATNGGVGAATNALTTKGSVTLVAPGASCPVGYTPQTLAATAAAAFPVEAQSSKTVTVGATKSRVIGEMLKAGRYETTGRVTVGNPAKSTVDQLVKCVIVDGNDQTLPGTTAIATIPAGASSHYEETVPIIGAIDVPVDEMVGIDCKNATPATGPRATTSSIPGLELLGKIPTVGSLMSSLPLGP